MAHRIAIVGTSGTGKTTLALQAAEKLGIPHVELDALFWGPNWTQPTSLDFYDRVSEALAGDAWVVDGNYLRVRALIWTRATTVVWLNYGLPLVLWRITRRTIARSLQHQELWNGCYESLQKGFLSRDSVILWALKTYYPRQREFPEWFRLFHHLEVVELRSPVEAEEWLASLPPAPN
jgi:adenylate kinase family enzyme